MARPSEPHRKEEVLEGAVAFLAENGLAGLSMRKLAAHLGVSTNVISYQFGSKEGLIAAAIDRARLANLEMLEVLRAENTNMTAAQGVQRLWDWYREKPERFAYPRLGIEAIVASTSASKRRMDMIEFWNDYFARWLVSEGWSEGEAEELSSGLNALLTGLILEMFRTGDFDRAERALDRFVLLIDRH